MTTEELIDLMIEDTKLMREATATIDALRKEIIMLRAINTELSRRNTILSGRVEELGGYSD